MAPMKVGPCRGSFPRWHYNAASEKCQKFIFGGCRENLNNYLSEDECTKACAGSGVASAFSFLDLDSSCLNVSLNFIDVFVCFCFVAEAVSFFSLDVYRSFMTLAL